ncbi:hypothetical protein K7432_005952 [Basidiobolus ranarum]|uniref:Ligatin n=1 Tax=Basidiobolus ranarum TaxID=34480 RepID=A0ABR2WVS3_9FUNG
MENLYQNHATFVYQFSTHLWVFQLYQLNSDKTQCQFEMFKKPFTLKTVAPLRSSDRRRSLAEIKQHFAGAIETTEKPEEIEEETSENVGNKEGQENKPELLPSDVSSAKFSSHIKDHGIIYFDNKQNPLWLKIDSKGSDITLIPTVYTLWKFPNLLPSISTHTPVVSRLLGGADLMLPGFITPPNGFPELRRGDLVSIVIRGHPAPVAVGRMAVDTSEIPISGPRKGKGVYILHVYRDYLWSHGDKSDPPEFKALEAVSDGEMEMNDEGAETRQEVPEEKPETNLTVAEIDDIFKASLLQALKVRLTPDGASQQLPMMASAFYSGYILASRPVNVDIKQSSYKKVAKFFKAMEKKGLFKCKEMRGELHLMGVNWQHKDLTDFVPYKVPTVAASTSQPPNSGAKPTNNSNSAPSGEIKIVEIYKVSSTVAPLFDDMKASKDSLYDKTELRNLIMDYVKIHGLANPKDQRMVRIDPILCDALLKKQEYSSVNFLARDQCVLRLLANMHPYHLMETPGQEPVVKKGNVKPIQITIEARQGRKAVTKITGMEHFQVSVNDLAKQLQTLCASSVAVNELPIGKNTPHPISEILVQGHQEKKVIEELTARGVPSKHVQLNDKTAKKKK